MAARFVVGCDFSLSSPGVMVMDLKSRVLYGLCWASRKREIGLHSEVDRTFTFYKSREAKKFVLTVCDPIDSKSEVVSRADKIANDLMALLQRLGCTPGDTVVGIEGYAFNAQGCSMTRLSELGGICKHTLFRHGFTYCEYPPTHVKKMFTGKGNANKLEMCQFYHKQDAKRPSLFDMLNLRLSAKQMVPHPIEDLVDAFGLVVTTYRHHVSKDTAAKKVSKKRKAPDRSSSCAPNERNLKVEKRQ